MFVRVLAAFSLLVPVTAVAGSEMTCIQAVELKIQELYPPMRFVGEIERKGSIVLRQFADCKTGKPLVPLSLPESLNWLDMALPFDFKKGLTGGDYINPYVYTEYGSSVDDDLYDHFTEVWQLGPKSAVCREPAVADVMKREEFGCFTVLLGMLRDGYKNPQPVDPLWKK